MKSYDFKLPYETVCDDFFFLWDRLRISSSTPTFSNLIIITNLYFFSLSISSCIIIIIIFFLCWTYVMNFFDFFLSFCFIKENKTIIIRFMKVSKKKTIEYWVSHQKKKQKKYEKRKKKEHLHTRNAKKRTVYEDLKKKRARECRANWKELKRKDDLNKRINKF